MPEDLFDQPEHRAAERLAAARRLVARGKLRDALDALNLAIQLAPGSPEAFRERAGVFDRMGLFPQAEADRRRADELAALLPPSLPEEAAPDVTEDVEEPEPTESPEDIEETEDSELPEEVEAVQPPGPGPGRAASEPPMPPWHPQYGQGPIPPDIPREGDRGPGLGALVFALLAIALFIVVVGAGVLLAIDTLGGGGDGSSGSTPGPSGVAAGDGSATPTTEPTPAGSPSTAGSPYSLADVVAAWQAKGMTVETGGAGEGFAGFEAAPAEVTMSRAGSTATAAVFVYDSPDDAKEEWDLVVGNRPSARGSRTVPSHVSAWWNANVVVVLLSDPGGLGPDALDGFINIGG